MTTLILGLPRSGTTWLAKLIDSSPEVYYKHEPDSHVPLAGLALVEPNIDADSIARVAAWCAGIATIDATPVDAKRPIFPKRYLSPPALWGYRCSVLAARALGLRRVLRPAMPADSAARLVWKSIESVGRLPLLLAACPHLRCIYLLRNPLGQIASIRRGYAQQVFSSATRPEHDSDVLRQLSGSRAARALGITESDYTNAPALDVLVRNWLIYNQIALDCAAQRPEQVLVVRYEDLCTDPLQQLARCMAFIGLTMTDQTRAFVARSSGTRDSAYYGVFRDSAAMANAWRREYSEREVRRAAQLLRGSMAHHHYADLLQ